MKSVSRKSSTALGRAHQEQIHEQSPRLDSEMIFRKREGAKTVKGGHRRNKVHQSMENPKSIPGDEHLMMINKL